MRPKTYAPPEYCRYCKHIIKARDSGDDWGFCTINSKPIHEDMPRKENWDVSPTEEDDRKERKYWTAREEWELDNHVRLSGGCAAHKAEPPFSSHGRHVPWE